MNIGEAVKERIIELCRERDISINKLCNMRGVTQSTVNNIVSGRNNSATISTIKKLCDGLGITIQEFLHQICLLIWSRRSNKTGGDCSMQPPPDVISPNALFRWTDSAELFSVFPAAA